MVDGAVGTLMNYKIQRYVSISSSSSSSSSSSFVRFCLGFGLYPPDLNLFVPVGSTWLVS